MMNKTTFARTVLHMTKDGKTKHTHFVQKSPVHLSQEVGRRRNAEVCPHARAEAAQGRKFNLYIRQSNYVLNTIRKSYSEVAEGDLLALFSSTGYLEIAINKGNADELLGLQLNDMVRFEFI